VWTFFFVVPALLFCISCISNRHYPFSDSPAAVPAPRETSRIYDYDQAPLDVRNVDLANEASEHYQVKRLTFTSYGRNGQQDDQVDVLWYLGKKKGPKPTVIILPIWGSYTYPSNRISAGLRKLGEGAINILQVTGERRVLDWAGMGVAATEDEFIGRMRNNLERIRTHAIDISRLVDWAVSSMEVDPDRIGLVGFSLSAVETIGFECEDAGRTDRERQGGDLPGRGSPRLDQDHSRGHEYIQQRGRRSGGRHVFHRHRFEAQQRSIECGRLARSRTC
jgi:hypothetical protein